MSQRFKRVREYTYVWVRVVDLVRVVDVLDVVGVVDVVLGVVEVDLEEDMP